MTWIRRAPWWLLALVVGAGGITVATASTLALTSKNLTVMETCVLTASSGTSVVAVDSGVQQGSATTNFGTGTSANVTSQSTSNNRRIYLRFDLSQCSPAIPSTAAIKLATLRLYLTAIPGGGVCRTDDIFKVSSSWTEGGITWNNQPFGTANNNPASGSRTDSFTVGPSSAGCQNTTVNQYVTGWAVTTDVQAFVAGTSTNYGWMIRDDVEGNGTSRVATYSMREVNTLAQSPQLVVNYT